MVVWTCTYCNALSYHSTPIHVCMQRYWSVPICTCKCQHTIQVQAHDGAGQFWPVHCYVLSLQLFFLRDFFRRGSRLSLRIRILLNGAQSPIQPWEVFSLVRSVTMWIHMYMYTCWFWLVLSSWQAERNTPRFVSDSRLLTFCGSGRVRAVPAHAPWYNPIVDFNQW